MFHRDRLPRRITAFLPRADGAQEFIVGGYSVIIDAAMQKHFRRYRWCARVDHEVPYFVTEEGYEAHHIVLRVHANRRLEVDHINGDPLDYRRENLRVIALSSYRSENRGNWSITYARRSGRWSARRTICGERESASFSSREEAVAWIDPCKQE
jgi:hypothetical protein